MGLIEDAKTAVGAAFCSGFQGYDRISRFAANLAYPDRVDSVYPLSPAGGVANAGIALFCDRPPDTPPSPSFSGGQCFVNYFVSATTDRYINNDLAQEGEVSVPGFPLAGPITDVRISANGTKITVDYGNNLSLDFPSGSGPAGTNRRNLRDVTVTRQDGLPDDCGDPESPVTPLPESDRTFPIDFGLGIGPVIFFAPRLTVNGNLNVPFTIEVGEVNVTGELSLNTGEINLNFGGTPTQLPPDIVPTPDSEVPPAEQDDPNDDRPANIIGVIVVAVPTGQNTATEIPVNGFPNLLIPRLADVSFKIRIKNKSHWTSDLPVKSRNAYIACPGEIDAIDVVAVAQKGWQISYTPVRGVVPSNQVVLV